ncbi:retinoblastoma-like protein 1 isoform X2 [Gigantopelta aegis]|uniref:retinoblastoma-like protein 1 isoform X2 n=1 Tax=Gigantopelta aegis TaxID=1735272 RepID=UPI001B88D521|nr:retinoblastoma-like protein 1 isoform X2 [Gigantopelta aegis]
MGLSDEGEESVLQRYEELCLDLNMDKNAKEDAWQSYQRIRTNFTLEGDQMHWLACALYESCRRSVVPTVGRGQVEGNCVSLTRLLRSARFSLIQFFSKMKKWSDMANLPQEFRDKVDKLERNFAVSTVIFKKFEPIFLDIFQNPLETNKQQRSRKQRRLPCSSNDVFNFAWTMFVQVKGHFPAISDDLVNSYHLLLCCVDWFYANALLGARKDLLNSGFSGLPSGYHSRDWRPPAEPPCVIKLLCEKHDGLVVEAKTIKEHWWKPHIKKLFDRKILKGKVETLSAMLEIGNFEVNSKVMNSRYEEYVLSVGDFDERIFLGEDAEDEIGTPGKASADLAEEMEMKKKSLKDHFEETRTLAPSTPLTGRRYLKEKDPSITPVSTATQSVSRLQALLSGRKTSPSDALIEIFKDCSHNPNDEIVSRIKEMGNTFCDHYIQPSDGHPGAHIDFAKRRLQLGESLYYKLLESIVLDESRRTSKDQKVDLSALLGRDVFHRSLFACCLEIVIFSYNSQRTFPWILDVFELSAYHLYKVFEIVIRAEESLSRDVVKHLNHIEESILESLAWKSDSALWDAVRDENGNIPSCEDVTPPSQVDNNSNVTSSPMIHPRVRSLVGEDKQAQQKNTKIVDPLHSPTAPSASERFSSPQPGTVKRQLFGPKNSGTMSTPKSVLEKQLSSGLSDSVTVSTPAISTGQTIIAVTSDGRQVLIPVQTLLASPSKSEDKSTPTSNAATSPKNNKPKKTGSLSLFFRKVYQLVSVRLRDLCDRLEVGDEGLQKKMWTCFEYVLMHNIDLMMDRHLDQIVMCSIYVMAKVTDHPLTFQNIMKCYRIQPQAVSHVYRSVLLNGRRRHTSGSSESSKSATSGSSSPVNTEKEDTKEKRRAENLIYIRSTSTLPVPNPNSQPPTPTKLTGMGSTFDLGEERGDLIEFYNTVFVKRIKDFALKFSSQNQTAGSAPPLSLLPLVRNQPSSPRRVSSKYSVYISPHNIHMNKPTQPKGISYCINRSPAKELRAINNMIRMGERKLSGKRQLEVNMDEDSVDSPNKRMCGSHFMRRLQDINSERQEVNGAAK